MASCVMGMDLDPSDNATGEDATMVEAQSMALPHRRHCKRALPQDAPPAFRIHSPNFEASQADHKVGGYLASPAACSIPHVQPPSVHGSAHNAARVSPLSSEVSKRFKRVHIGGALARVALRCADGTIHSFNDVDLGDDVLDFKHRVFERLGLPVDLLTLLYKGSVMADFMSLRQCGVEDGAVLSQLQSCLR